MTTLPSLSKIITKMTRGKLFGVAEDGNLYVYSPQELDSTMLAENLSDGLSSYQVLNTESDSGFLPILLGVLGAGALAGAGGGGGGSGQAAILDAPSVELRMIQVQVQQTLLQVTGTLTVTTKRSRQYYRV